MPTEKQEDLKKVTIRGREAWIPKECPHWAMKDWEERYRLDHDIEGTYNKCALCAADASSQVKGGLNYEEIGKLEGMTKMGVVFVERRAIDKVKKAAKDKFDIEILKEEFRNG